MNFKQKLSVFLIATSLSTGALTAGNGSTPKGKPFVAINGQIVEVNGAISNLQDQIDEIVVNVDTIEERVTANEDAVLLLQGINADLQLLIDNNISNIDDINTTVATLESDLLALQGDVENNADAITTYETLIASLQSAILDIENGLIALDADLQPQIDHNTALIAAIEVEVDMLNAVLEQKQDIVDGVCPSGEQAISQVLADGSVVCTDINSSSESNQLYTYKLYQTVPIPAHTSVHVELVCTDSTHKAVNLGWNAGIAINKYYQSLAGPYGRVAAYNTGNYSQSFNYELTCAYVAP